MGTSYNANIVTDGLVLCLDAANPRSYPLSGTSWNDLSGNGNNGTLTNNTYTTENAGAINFDNTDDRVHIPYHFTNVGNNGQQEGTVITWFKATNATNLSSANMQYYMIPCTNSFILYFYRNAHWSAYALSNFLYYRRASDGGTGYDIPSIYYQPNIWYQNAITWTTNGIKIIYRNTDAAHTANRSSDFDYWYGPTGGGFHIDPNYTTEGSISIFQMYNRPLSAQEIRQNFNATRGRYGI
jgi:hypothetical protein